MHSPGYHLKELLFDYDCVTIPGFGGFIMQSQQARIDRAKHRIYPPSRIPTFNSLLNHDDGLLISCMAKAGNISYREAGNMVRDFAENLTKRIYHSESVLLEGIGELKKGTEGTIIFTPAGHANFLAATFGMEPLNLYPVSRLPQKERTIKKPADRKAMDFRERKPASVKWTLAFSIPVILFLLYGIIFPASIQNIYTNYSGIIIDLLHADKAQPAAIRDFHEIRPLPVPVVAHHIIPSHQASITPAIVTETAVAAPTPVSAKYYIIGGCFEKEENALKFLDNLLEQGFEAEKAGRTKHGHLRISYKSFAEKQPALSYLQKIKDEENPSAWLLKY
jgi:nucleoid DNA-binding protein